MYDILTEGAAKLLPVLVNLLVAIAIYYARIVKLRFEEESRARLKEHDAAYVSGVLDRFARSADDAVNEAAMAIRPVWEEAVKDGKVEPHELREITEKAREILESYLGPKGLGELNEIFDAETVKQMMTTKVQALVARLYAEAVK